MNDVPTATKIAALEEQVRQLTAAVTRECDRRIEETERLRCELDGQEATRKFRAAELHAVRLALDERNAYAERLLAENVRLTNEAAEVREDLANARAWIDGQDVRSDFKNATAMRNALDRERERVLEWNVLVAQGCTPGGSEFHDCPQNVAYYITERLADKDRIMKSQQKELNKERERCGVLEAEVLAWHAAEHLRKDEPHNEFMRLAEARFRTRETHALDPAKFVGKP